MGITSLLTKHYWPLQIWWQDVGISSEKEKHASKECLVCDIKSSYQTHVYRAEVFDSSTHDQRIW